VTGAHRWPTDREIIGGDSATATDVTTLAEGPRAAIEAEIQRKIAAMRADR
jgi:hypothetical protein